MAEGDTVNIAASKFMLRAVLEWGQPEEERIAAVQQLLDIAGFDAKATTWPVFGGIWSKPCEGPDGRAADEWLKRLTSTMKRGKYEVEEAHVEKFINERLGK